MNGARRPERCTAAIERDDRRAAGLSCERQHRLESRSRHGLASTHVRRARALQQLPRRDLGRAVPACVETVGADCKRRPVGGTPDPRKTERAVALPAVRQPCIEGDRAARG